MRLRLQIATKQVSVNLLTLRAHRADYQLQITTIWTLPTDRRPPWMPRIHGWRYFLLHCNSSGVSHVKTSRQSTGIASKRRTQTPTAQS